MPRSTRADLAKHSGKDDAWMTIDGKVYDVSKYLEDHPVGLNAAHATRTICPSWSQGPRPLLCTPPPQM